ncbi:MAG: DUF1573 domain-containing protein [Spirochaetes bacterium]|nr:DUF1573 domain-containing protein [Spirochaetota bacterium]
MKKYIKLIITLSALILLSLSCMNDRDNPHDPGAGSNYYDGIPEISIKQDITIIPDNGLFETDDTIVEEYIDVDFQIENTGTGYLFMENMQITQSNMFAIIKMPNTPIDPGRTSEFTVRFAPTSEGKHSIIIIVNYFNADDELAEFSFTITGTGIN